MKITFLGAANNAALSKTFTPSEKISYPKIKSFNSVEYEHDLTKEGVQDRFKLILEHAAKGHCLLKGQLTEPLQNASRAGKTDRETLARTLVIDVDGWEQTGLVFPEKLTREHLKQYAESIITFLPSYLQDVTYIAHASSSLGVKAGSVSLHLEFFLREGIKDTVLKNWIKEQNFANTDIERKLRLTNSGMSLSWVLDPAMAENSRLIYISPPQFIDLPDPFESPEERWALVEKDKTLVDLMPYAAGIMPAGLQKLREDKINELRRAKGLGAFKPKTRMLMDRGSKVSVIQNPDEVEMELVRVVGDYAHFNVNGGDSNAYWVRLDSPEIVYNFKDEPPFEFAKACPKAYADFMQEYGKEILAKQTIMPLVVRDFYSDRHFAVMYDRPSDRILLDENGSARLAEISPGNIEAFMIDNGAPKPDPVPTWDVRFDPTTTKVAEFDRSPPRLNTYAAPDIIREPAAILPEFKGLKYKQGESDLHSTIQASIKLLCPTIYRLTWHVSGSDLPTYAHFINWLAWCLQNRRVSNTAWIFSGVPGTGKGLFENRVLKPLVGPRYVQKIRRQNLMDTFNSSILRESLFCVVDEFRLGDSKNGEEMYDYIKELTASETGQVRAMRVESKEVPFYMNWIFFSNHRDVMAMPDNDRRMNIAPPQQRDLKSADPELLNELDNIKDELPIFASILLHMDASEDEARTCMDNEAKRNMRVASLNSAQQFCYAVLHGDLDYMVEHIMVDTSKMTDINWVARIVAAKRLVNTWMKAAVTGKPINVEVDELLHVWQAMNPDVTANVSRFRNMLVRNDIDIRKESVNGKPTSFVQIEWGATITDFNALSESDMIDKDTKTLFQGVLTCQSQASH